MIVQRSVLVDRVGEVLVITLNRPHVRNAIDHSVAEGVAEALDALDGDPALKVGVLTGAGGSFCVGRDLRAFLRGDVPSVPGRGLAGIVRRGARKPTIAAVEGFAVAGGFEIALACDLIVAARGAKLGIPEVKRSLVPSGGALLRLPQRLPYGIVMELALTGDLIDAERCFEHGVVNRLVEPGTALEASLELAGRIATNGPLALVAAKEIVQRQRDWSEEEFWDRQHEIVAPVFSSEDAREGAAAFLEKRPPAWHGR